MSSGFLTESFIFDPRPSYPLLSVVKRYWKAGSANINDPDALTLIFAHGTGFHKEQWEPVIDDLQALLDADVTNTKIREIWTIDAPNHGDAAVLNEESLKLGYDSIFGWEEYARSIHLFLSGLGTGVNHDFTGHKLVGIGHSMGAVSLALSLGYYPKVKYASLVLCEVMIMPAEFGSAAKDMLVNGAVNRRDIWPSKEDAYNILKSRGSWKSWDERVLKIYVESGMRHLPTSEYPDKKDGVTLKCTRKQEAACYRDSVGSSRVYHNLKEIVKQVPTHLIYGQINDYLPEAVKDAVKEKAGGVQKLMSFSRVPGGGHLVPQTNPSGLAVKIYEALSITSQTVTSRGKL